MRRGVKRRWGVGALIFTALTGLFNLHKYVQVISLGGFFTARDFEGRQVISWIGVPALQAMIDRYWEGNMFCEEIQALRQQHNDSHMPITVNNCWYIHVWSISSDWDFWNRVHSQARFSRSAKPISGPTPVGSNG